MKRYRLIGRGRPNPKPKFLGFSAYECGEFIGFGPLVLFATEAIKRQFPSGVERWANGNFGDAWIQEFFSGSEYLKAYIRDYGEKTGFRGFAILAAHGYRSGYVPKDGEMEWRHRSGRENASVPKWLAEHDGRYGCIFVATPPPRGFTSPLKKSLLIVTPETFDPSLDDAALLGLMGLRRQPAAERLFSPEHGEVSNKNAAALLDRLGW